MKVKKTEDGYTIELDAEDFKVLMMALDDSVTLCDEHGSFEDKKRVSKLYNEIQANLKRNGKRMKVNGYEVTIEDYDLWKDKIDNLEAWARLKAEQMILLYQQTKQLIIVGADIVDNEGWVIRIYPESKKVTCKFYKD